MYISSPFNYLSVLISQLYNPPITQLHLPYYTFRDVVVSFPHF